ncbi:MAG TPA: ATP-binding SpoIIE family protein phosphatase [Puia sp.]|jgi:anti-sigma regulatory factor (Ser/Thr protein kinase)
MAENPHTKYSLPDRTYQGIVRSELKKMAEQAGFSGHRLGEVEIIIAEITSNLVKHTLKGGEILARILVAPSAGIEFISIDNGPGMNRPDRMMEDGLSTSNTLGQGLGAIRRLSNVFDLYSLPGWGTIVYSRIYTDKKFTLPEQTMEISSISVCKKNETLCGDLWTCTKNEKRYRLAIIDGLGHGASANEAAKTAVECFVMAPKNTPVEELRFLHENLKKTRGGVVTVAYIDEINQQITYSGVGNITMKIVSNSRTQGCMSYNGIVGHIMPASLNNHMTKMEKKTDALVMHSDGLSARWDIQKYPGILIHPGVVLCAALYKDFDRGNDDSTILVAKFVK